MSLYTVSSGNTINAADVNQLVNVLQAGSGATETGQYYLGFDAYDVNALGSMYLQTRSHGATPVSVTVDTSIQSPSNCVSPTTNGLSQYGFQLYSSSTNAAHNCHLAGAWTVQY